MRNCPNRGKIRWCTAVLVLVSFCGIRSQTPPYPEYTITELDTNLRGYFFFTAIKVTSDPGTSRSINTIMDTRGRIVYFKKFSPSEKTMNFQLHDNRRISYYVRGKHMLMDTAFRIIDSVWTMNGVVLDVHDFQVLKNGNYMLLGFEENTSDESRLHLFNKNKSPGSKTALIRTGVLQEQNPDREVVFEWRSRKHFRIEDMDTFYVTGPATIDLTHFNSVEEAPDGNFLVSSRNVAEITKIKRSDSSIIWRLGGKRNSFRYINDTIGFIRQHDPRLLGNGNLTLFDNGHDGKPFHPARAIEYKMDETNKTATLVWSYINDNGAFSSGSGSARRINSELTIINYGVTKNARVMFNVVDSSGKKSFEVYFNDTLTSYRTYYYPTLPWKLRRPAVRPKRIEGKLYLEAEGPFEGYVWTDGRKGRRIPVTKAGNYQAFGRIGRDEYVCSDPVLISKDQISDRKNNAAKK